MKQTKPSRVSKIENPRQKIEIVYSFFYEVQYVYSKIAKKRYEQEHRIFNGKKDLPTFFIDPTNTTTRHTHHPSIYRLYRRYTSDK